MLSVIALSNVCATSPNRLAVEAMLSDTEGLISRSSGNTFSLIIFRLTLAIWLLQSVTNACPIPDKYASMSERPMDNNGRTMKPFFGFIPNSPWIPVPRIRLSKKVSTESSLIFSQLFKITIAQFACGHLNADTMKLGIGLCIEMDTMEWDLLSEAKLLTK